MAKLVQAATILEVKDIRGSGTTRSASTKRGGCGACA
jgi:hypothetical protein